MALSKSSSSETQLVAADGTGKITHISERYLDVPMGLMMLNRVKQDWRVWGLCF
jgi:hypothetical protein